MLEVLIQAIENNDVQQVEQALGGGIDIEVKFDYEDRKAITPIALSVIRNTIEVFKYLLSRGADVHFKTQKGNGLLHFAAYHADIDIFKILETEGLDINASAKPGDKKTAPFFYACANDNVEVVKYLVEEKAFSVNDCGGINNPPLHYSVKHNAIKVINYLLDAGADVNRTNALNVKALHLACEANALETVKLLVLFQG